MSSLHALCCLLSMKGVNTRLPFFFVQCTINNKAIILNNQGPGKSYKPQPLASADSPCHDHDHYSGYHKNLIQ